MEKNKKLYIAGHMGMVGSNILRKCKAPEVFSGVCMGGISEVKNRIAGTR